jgi:tetratricopeptide (TPR) repeat protein
MVALLGIFICGQLMIDAALHGFSRLYSTLAIIQPGTGAADRAVTLTPKDPEAHYTRGLSLVNLGRLTEASVELQQAVRLRPYYYYEWLDLGVTLDRLGDQEGALAALNQSVRLAPTFAQPRWQLGSFLFRREKYPEAFAELRLGAKSNPTLFNGMLDLAWMAANGDLARMELLIEPQSGQNRLALASFLAKQGKGADAARHVRAAGAANNDVERSLLRQTIETLLANKQFSEAYAAWEATHVVTGPAGSEQILNGDFLDPIEQNDPGFGWQLPASPNVAVSIDPAGPIGHSRSLFFKFNGDSPPQSQLLSHLVLVQPKTRYSVSFTVRTEELVTGGPPVIFIFDLSSQPAMMLGQSTPLATGTSEWKSGKVDFSTGDHTLAISVALQRLACSQNPCPIFGKFWLSRFTLMKQ